MADFPDFAFQLLLGGENDLGGMEVFFTGVGYTERGNGTVKDFHAQFFFHMPQHLAQGGLAHIQLLCRSGDAAAFGNGFDVVCLFQIHRNLPPC